MSSLFLLGQKRVKLNQPDADMLLYPYFYALHGCSRSCSPEYRLQPCIPENNVDNGELV